jgi:hypothetical protein
LLAHPRNYNKKLQRNLRYGETLNEIILSYKKYYKKPKKEELWKKAFIENPDKILTKYPLLRVHKAILCLILAMAKIRHKSYYASEIDSAVSLTKILIFSMIFENDEVDYKQLKNDTDKVFGIMLVLPDLKKIELITKYCQEKMPAGNIDTFENYFKKRFN